MNCSKDSDHAFGAVERVLGEAGFEHFVGADVVDDDFVLLLDVDDGFAQLGVVEGFDGVLNDLVRAALSSCSVSGLSHPGRCQIGFGLLDVPVRIEGFDDLVAEILDAEAAGQLPNLLVVLRAHAVFHAREAAGQ